MILRNFLLFIMIMNLMCGVVAVIPDNELGTATGTPNQSLFAGASLETDDTVFDEDIYDDITTGDQTDDPDTVLSVFISRSVSVLERLKNAFFGLSFLLGKALGTTGASGGPINAVIFGLDVVNLAAWALFLYFALRGTVLE